MLIRGLKDLAWVTFWTVVVVPAITAWDWMEEWRETRTIRSRTIKLKRRLP